MLHSSQVKFTSERFILQPISEKVILKPLGDLKVKNATGLDGIPARFLKDSDAIIAPTQKNNAHVLTPIQTERGNNENERKRMYRDIFRQVIPKKWKNISKFPNKVLPGTQIL